ncbi:MAG: HDOD domain-containing protein, partial [Rhodothermales bacterium]|nr:HDOD domain-containing protein [Rhodothermales bacterium]
TAEHLRSVERDGASGDALAVTGILSGDPLSVLTVLKRANHAYYGYLGSVESLTHAVELLTPQSVTSFLLELSERDAGESSVVVRLLSEHARETGRFAHRLRTGIWLFESERQDLPGSIFTTALLHSAGRLVLASSFPDMARTLYGDGNREGLFVQRDWSLAERLQFGADSVEVAEYVFGKLHLPEYAAAVIRLAGRPGGGSPTPACRQQAALIRLSSELASAAGYGLSSSVSYLEILQDDYWRPYVDTGVVDEKTSIAVRDEFPRLRAQFDRSKPLAERESDRASLPGSHASRSTISSDPARDAEQSN